MVQKQRKILFVLEHFYPYIGGAEKLFYQLATSLVQKGFDVTVVTTLYERGLKKEETHEGVKIIRVNCFNRFGFTFFSLPKVFRYAKGADFIHTTTYNAALPSILVGMFLRKKVLVTFHEVWAELWKKLPFTNVLSRNAFYYFEKLLLKLPFYRFVAVSEFTKSKLVENGIPEEKVILIYNGIDYSQFEKYNHTPPETFTYTYFGRLGISKGLDLLIPAVASFRKTYPNSRLKLILPKRPKGLYLQIINLIASHNLEAHIDLLHNLPQEKLYHELLNSTCLVIPSYSEGFCFAAAEGVALGVPIISSHQGALKEVVSGKHIYMENQSIEALNQALEKAYKNDWSQSEAKYYDFEDSLKGYLEIYDGLFD